MTEPQYQCQQWNNEFRPDYKRTINRSDRVHPIEFDHDAESHSNEYEDTGFHKQ